MSPEGDLKLEIEAKMEDLCFYSVTFYSYNLVD